MSEVIGYAELQARKENKSVTFWHRALRFEQPDVNALIASIVIVAFFTGLYWALAAVV